MSDVKNIVMDPKAIEVFKRPLPKELIKQRDGGGGKKLDYIGGETAIELLNEGFGYVWCDEVISKEIIQCVPRPLTAWNDKTRKKEPVLNADGSAKMEEQPPYVEVRVRITHISSGVFHEGFGTKILLGGASEQEGCSKAAHTDALKKAATKFGIGLELYSDKEPDTSTPVQSGGYKKDYPAKNTPAPAAPKKEEPNPWAGKEAEIRKLKELKAILGVDDNDKLNPFVAEFTGSKSDTYEKIGPASISAFNKFLEKKAANA